MTRKERSRKTAHGSSVLQADDELSRKVLELRRDLHTSPETAFEEKRTASRIVEFFSEAGLRPVAEEIAGHGLLFRLDGGRDGPSVMLEADLDALPLTEKTGVDYASKTEGKHHACGHDGHMAMVAGAMAALAQDKEQVPGRVYALFQPAEETGEGAERVMRDPRVGDLELDVVYGVHNLPGYPIGSLIVRSGAMASASVGVHFRFHGETSHAAAPHKGKSSVAALSQLSLRATALPAEVLPYGNPALVTPIHLEAGKIAFGTAAGSGSARFTLRAASDEDLSLLCEGLHEEAQALADADGLKLEMEKVEPFPATVNDPSAVKKVLHAARETGFEVVEPDAALAWSEDFGHFNSRWPGALVCLGSGEDQPELHRPDFDFPDELLTHGIRFWKALVIAEGKNSGEDVKKQPGKGGGVT